MAGGGSHSWVEAWDQGKWSFVDPGEYRPLNDTWFYPYPAQLQVPSSPRCGHSSAHANAEGIGNIVDLWQQEMI